MSNQILDNNLNNVIQFEISGFKNKCLEIYEGSVNSTLEKVSNELKTLIDIELIKVQNNLKRTIGNELYNYDNLPNIIYPDYKKFNYHNLTAEYLEYLKKFEEIVDGEKVILFNLCGSCNHNARDPVVSHFMYITNFGRVLLLKSSDYFGSQIPNSYLSEIKIGMIIYKAFDFWIPKDYILLLNHLFSRKTINIEEYREFVGYPFTNMSSKIHTYYDSSQYISGDSIIFMLSGMKSILYDRKYIPLYLDDIILENGKLRMLHDLQTQEREEFLQEKNKFLEEKHEFENINKPYIELKEEQNQIESIKETLKNIFIKLKLERQELEQERIQLGKEKEQVKEKLQNLDNVNLTEIIKIDQYR